MAKSIIGVGTVANDGTGDTLRSAGVKINDNFSELYNALGDGTTLAVADVATTGSYNDLSDTPTIPADLSDLTDTTTLLFDGAYASLTDAPTIPADLSDLTDTTNLLFDGSYSSLSGTPTLIGTPTNHFYVDPARTDSYTSTGSINAPYKTVGAALTAIDTLIEDEVIVPGEANPIFVILQGNTTEDITLSVGHIFLVSDQGSIHTPIYFNGTITVNGADTSTSALDNNHFSISGLTIVGDAQQAGIYFTGSNAQRLMLNDVWLTARGNQTGTTPFTDAGGYGIYADNTGVRAADSKHSVVHGSNIKVSHTGTGDVYCFRITGGTTADFSLVETSGATQVGAVGSGSFLSFTNSQLDANGEVCVEAYGTGVLALTNSTISNARTGTESYGVWLHSVGSSAIIGQCYFNVADTSQAGSRAVKGITGTVLISANNLFAKNSSLSGDTNVKIDSAVTRVALTSSFTSV